MDHQVEVDSKDERGEGTDRARPQVARVTRISVENSTILVREEGDIEDDGRVNEALKLR